MQWCSLIAFILTVSVDAQATDEYGARDNGFGNETLLCNSTIAQANASGVFTFPVQFPIASATNTTTAGEAVQYVPDPSWALTVDVANDSTVQSTLWYDTAGQNYSDDVGIGYDACAFVIYSLPQNTIRLGQNDPGDCSAMLSDPCRKTILSRASESAQKWTSYASPPPYSNLSAGVLPTLCGYIAGDLGDNGKSYPKECAQDFGYSYDEHDVDAYNSGVSTSLLPLTGYNDSILNNEACTLQSGEKTFRVAQTELSTTANAYDTMTRAIMPILSVYFTVANAERTTSQSFAPSTMSCVRIKHFSEGSRVSPQLPKGTPYSYGSSSLSGGSIAGIIVGVLAFVAIVAFLAFWFWRRRRRQSRETHAEKVGPDYEGTELGGDARHELKSDDRKIETDSSPISELGGGGGEKRAELGGWTRAELDGGPTAAEKDGNSHPTELG